MQTTSFFCSLPLYACDLIRLVFFVQLSVVHSQRIDVRILSAIIIITAAKVWEAAPGDEDALSLVALGLQMVVGKRIARQSPSYYKQKSAND